MFDYSRFYILLVEWGNQSIRSSLLGNICIENMCPESFLLFEYFLKFEGVVIHTDKPRMASRNRLFEN